MINYLLDNYSNSIIDLLVNPYGFYVIKKSLNKKVEEIKKRASLTIDPDYLAYLRKTRIPRRVTNSQRSNWKLANSKTKKRSFRWWRNGSSSRKRRTRNRIKNVYYHQFYLGES